LALGLIVNSEGTSVKTSQAGGHGGPCDDSGRADMAISVLFPPAIRDEQ
jgi:hypothetical protein